MADYSDGSIVVDSEINSDGFKADSKELADAIKSLSKQVESLGGIIKTVFAGNMREVSQIAGGMSEVGENARSAEGDVEGLNKEMSQLGTGATAPEIDLGNAKTSINSTEKEIGSLEKSLDKLAPVAQKAASGNEAAMGEFEAKADSAEGKIESLESKLQQLSNTQFSTQAYADLEQALIKADAKMDNLQKRQEKMDAMGVNKSSASYKSLQYDIEQTAAEIERLERGMEHLSEKGQAFKLGADLPQIQSMTAALSSAKQRLTDMRTEMSGTANSGSMLQRISNGLHGALQRAGDAAKNGLRKGLEGAGNAAKGLLNKVKDLGKNLLRSAGNIVKSTVGIRGFNGEATNADAIAGAMYKKFTGLAAMLKKKLLRGFISSIVSGLKEGMQNLALFSSDFNNTMSTLSTSTGMLKNSFAAAFAPVLSSVIPILATLISWLSTAISYIGMFFAALRGSTSVVKATKVQKDYAKSLKDTAGGGGAAAKATERQLAAFDELNVLSDSSSGGGGGGGGGADAAMDQFEEVPVESRVADFIGRIKKAFAEGEYEEVGRIIGRGINSAFERIDEFIKWDNVKNKVTKYVHIFCDIFNGMVDEIDWALIGKTFADGINTILHTSYLLVTGIDWANLGKGIVNGLNSLVKNIDWALLGKDIGAKLQAALTVIYTVITNFDWRKLGSSLATSLNNMLDSIDYKMLGATIGNALIGALNLVSGFLKKFDWAGLGRKIADFIEGVDWIGLLKSIGGLIADALGAAVKLALGLIIDIGGDIASGLLQGIDDLLGTNIGGWIDEHIVQPFIKWIKNLFGIHSPSTVMAEIGSYISEGLLQGIKDSWGKVTDWLGTALDGIKKKAKETWENVKKDAGTAWQNVKKTVSDKLGDAKKTVETVGKNIKQKASDTWTNVKTSVSNNLSKAKSTASTAWSSIKSTASTAGNNIKTAAKSAWTSVKSHITDNLTKAKSSASTTWSSIKSTASTAGSNIKSGASSAWSSIKSYITSNLNGAKSSSSSSWSSIKTAASNAASAAKSSAVSNFSTIASTVSGKISSARSAVSSGMATIKSSIVNNVSNAMRSVRNQSWSSIGSNIVSGIRNGLVNSWNWLKNTASNLAANLLRSVKNKLGIHSPSRVFRDEVGYMIGLGEAEGIEKSAGAVYGAVSSVAEGAIAAAQADSAVIDIGVANSDMVSDISGVLQSFSDKVVDSFTALANTLESISNRVAFAIPTIATGTVLPYNVAAKAEGGTDDVGSIIESTHEDMVSVLIQVVNNAVLAVVKAIEENGGSRDSISKDTFTQMVIDEINKRTRMSGKSPLLI